MISTLAISGSSGSGKTTLIEKLLPIFQARHIPIGVLKHTPHDMTADKAGSDTDRLIRAGASLVARVTSDRTHLMALRSSHENLDVTARRLFGSTCPVVLIEGGKSIRGPKIEVLRRDHSTMPLCDPQYVIAYVTDLEDDLPAPRLPLNDPEQTADFIEAWIRHHTSEITLTVRDHDIACNHFVTNTLSSVVSALTRELHHAADQETLELIISPEGHKPAMRLLAGPRRVPLKPFVALLVAATLRGLVSTLHDGPQPDEGFTLTLRT